MVNSYLLNISLLFSDYTDHTYQEQGKRYFYFYEMGFIEMTKKPWSTQELDKLIRLSSECPPVVIARELSRPVTSVRKKMREMGVSYVSGEQWKKSQIQFLISDEGTSYKNKHKLTQESKENEFESPVLDEFWTTLVKMARVAKKRGKRVDVLSFIDTYRKIRIGS